MELVASHCVFPTPDICATAEYYHHLLGFRRVDYLNAKEASLALDGTVFESIDDLYDSAIYFYNYITQGGAAAELTPADISLFTVDPDDTDKAQVALDKIQSLTNE